MKITRTGASPASVAIACPTILTSAPTWVASAASTPIRTGTCCGAAAPGDPRRVVRASAHRRPSLPCDAWDVTVIWASITRPSHCAASARIVAAAPADHATALQASSASTRTPRFRANVTTPRVAARHSATSAHDTSGANTLRSAQTQTAAATTGTRGSFTRSPAHGVPRASSRRCRELPTGRRPSGIPRSAPASR